MFGGFTAFCKPLFVGDVALEFVFEKITTARVGGAKKVIARTDFFNGVEDFFDIVELVALGKVIKRIALIAI